MSELDELVARARETGEARSGPVLEGIVDLTTGEIVTAEGRRPFGSPRRPSEPFEGEASRLDTDRAAG